MCIIGITLYPFRYSCLVCFYIEVWQTCSFCEFRIVVQIDNSVIMSFFFFLCTLNSGDYGDAITLETLKDFHLRRVQVLAESGPDLIAFETIPNKLEAQVFAYACWFQ